jgi:hypothetical protein
MLYALLLVTAPLLLVFGLYHLMTWFDVFRVGNMVYWKRVGLAAALAHVLLLTAVLVWSYVDFVASQRFIPAGTNYETFLFTHTEFRRLVTLFDTAAMLVLLLFLMLMDRVGGAGTILLPLTIAVTCSVGTLQWFLVGGGIGALLGRFWESLKTGDDDEEWL